MEICGFLTHLPMSEKGGGGSCSEKHNRQIFVASLTEPRRTQKSNLGYLLPHPQEPQEVPDKKP